MLTHTASKPSVSMFVKALCPGAGLYLWELLLLQVLSDSRVKILSIALVETVNVPLFFSLHIPVY